MGALDMVLNEVENRFGMSTTSAGSLLSSLLTFITQQDGGLSGFLDRFQRAGLGSWVKSWLGGDAKAIAPESVENVLGRNTIETMATKAGLSTSTATSAVAAMLPALIQKLAPGGTIPTRLPSDIMSYISGPTAALASGTRQAVYAAERAAEKTGISRWLWPLLALIVLALLGLWFWNRREPVKTSAFNVQEQLRLASERATTALASLKPGYSSQDLVGALNLYVINFSTGSAQLPSESYDFLNKAAAAMQAAPSGTTIEVGGHTDNVGDASANAQLSEKRADSVRDYLVKQGVNPSALVAKGYGDTRPVASNDTEEGRFRNRRIEFSVMR
ncbi:MAG TPA: OmpA family protein [Terriglobales bacterium]|nr:OmpA family protein [Terriglobales bacterium]